VSVQSTDLRRVARQPARLAEIGYGNSYGSPRLAYGVEHTAAIGPAERDWSLPR